MGNRCDDVDLLIPLLYVVIREYKYSKVLGNEGLEFKKDWKSSFVKGILEDNIKMGELFDEEDGS